MVLIFKYLLPKEFIGLTLWPVIILKSENLKEDEVLINHERIHLRQQLELLILPFYVLYLLEWLIKVFRYKGDTYMAYRNISFEREAYYNEQNPNYLENKKAFSFLNYLRG